MNGQTIIRVRDVMKREFDTVDGMISVKDALLAMKHIETKSLIVNKRNSDDEYGLLLLSDIAKNVLAKDRSPDRVNVYEVMTKPLISVHAHMDIRYCARLFDQFGLSRAPVIEDQALLGIVSYTDMVIHGMMEN